jgi:16S rRNA G527 N7-methylase RsmG
MKQLNKSTKQSFEKDINEEDIKSVIEYLKLFLKVSERINMMYNQEDMYGHYLYNILKVNK